MRALGFALNGGAENRSGWGRQQVAGCSVVSEDPEVGHG